MKDFELAGKTWPEVEKHLETNNIVIVPIGSIEQHGPALPLNNDSYVAQSLAELVAERAWASTKVLVAPAIHFGYSPHHMAFTGTITLQESTLVHVIQDVCTSLSKHGFRKIVLLNGHGGNETAISMALHYLRDSIEAKVFNIDWWSFASDKLPEIVSGPLYHACEGETSVSWHLGQRVLEELRVDEPGRKLIPGFVEPDMFATPPKVSMAYNMKDVTESGVVGYSTKATKEKGATIVKIVVDRILEFIGQIENL
jgi:creatinine amidohydrolase